MVVLIRHWEMVYKITKEDSDGTSKHGERFEGGRRKMYIKRGCLALEDFLFFSLYSFSCIAINSTTLEIY
jgi:hypothetical protein